jgi:hypothetical protein
MYLLSKLGVSTPYLGLCSYGVKGKELDPALDDGVLGNALLGASGYW